VWAWLRIIRLPSRAAGAGTQLSQVRCGFCPGSLSGEGRPRPDLVLVDYKPVARHIQDAMLAGKCQLYMDGIPARTRRREDEGGAAHTGLPREAVGVIDGMGEGAGAM